MDVLPNSHFSLLRVTLADWILIFAIDKDVIHKGNYTGEAFDDLTHASLKVLWSNRYTKWHLVETNRPKGMMKVVSRQELLARGDLPESTVGV